MKVKHTAYYIIGTVLGSGYMPKAPGTAGSLAAVLLYYLAVPSQRSLWIVTIVLLFIGVAAASYIEKKEGRDAPLIVIDELVGQWIAFFFLPKTLFILILGFIFFRLFDIFKPFPINALQKLRGGWGVMADDVLAGVYANLVLQIILLTGIVT